MNKTDLFRKFVPMMMEAVTLDAKGNLKVINEAAMAKSEDLLSQVITETAREWWAQLESAEDSLANMADEISFSELNADPSHVASAPLPPKKTGKSSSQTLESLLGGKDFNFGKIFEMAEDGHGDNLDGDEQYDDLMRGDDEAGIGHDGPIDDDGDNLGQGDSDFGADDQGDKFGDDSGFDDDLGDNDTEFDFSFLDDDTSSDDMDNFGDDQEGDDFGDDAESGDFGDDGMSSEFDDHSDKPKHDDEDLDA